MNVTQAIGAPKKRSERNAKAPFKKVSSKKETAVLIRLPKSAVKSMG
jgi:hypothetical protein